MPAFKYWSKTLHWCAIASQIKFRIPVFVYAHMASNITKWYAFINKVLGSPRLVIENCNFDKTRDSWWRHWHMVQRQLFYCYLAITASQQLRLIRFVPISAVTSFGGKLYRLQKLSLVLRSTVMSVFSHLICGRIVNSLTPCITISDTKLPPPHNVCRTTYTHNYL